MTDALRILTSQSPDHGRLTSEGMKAYYASLPVCSKCGEYKLYLRIARETGLCGKCRWNLEQEILGTGKKNRYPYKSEKSKNYIVFHPYHRKGAANDD